MNAGHGTSIEQVLQNRPLVLDRRVIRSVGLDNAVMLTALRDLIAETNAPRDSQGRTRLTFEQIHEAVPFWSLRTVKRRVNDLVQCGLVESVRSDESDPRDNARWYAFRRGC